MEIKFSKALSLVKLALLDTASKAEKRRLMIHRDEIPCRSGCSGCCSRRIEISMAEAVLIYQHVLDKGVWPRVKEVAKAQLPLVRSTDPVAWMKMNLKCPILDPASQKCSAYEVRPAICATHYVTSSPSLCDPWSTASGTYSPLDFNDLLVEFRKRAGSHVEGYGILSLELPIPLALLLAERINTLSGLTMEQAITVMFNEL